MAPPYSPYLVRDGFEQLDVDIHGLERLRPYRAVAGPHPPRRFVHRHSIWCATDDTKVPLAHARVRIDKDQRCCGEDPLRNFIRSVHVLGGWQRHTPDGQRRTLA